MQVNVVSFASEFPNDNPALHRGVIWVCRETTGLAEPERVLDPCLMVIVHGPSQQRDDEDEDEALIIEELEPLEAVSLEVEIAALPSSLSPRPTSPEIETVATIASMPILFEIEADQDEDEEEEDEAPETIVMASRVSEIILSGTRDFDVEEREEAIVMAAEAEAEAAFGAAQEEEAIATVTILEPSPPPSMPTNEDVDQAVATTAVTPVFEEIAFEEIATSDHVPQDSTQLPAAPDDPFTMLVCMLADVAIAAGSPHIASILPGLLFDGRLSEPLDDASADLLRANGLLTDTNEVAPDVLARAAAWSAILRGTSEDFDACGEAMLDEWSSDLLARLLNTPATSGKLRQELRSRGVAAFGLAA